jgi:hypothetical protein
MNVLISGGFSSAYEQPVPEFEQTWGVKVTTRSGASQRGGPQTTKSELAGSKNSNAPAVKREAKEDWGKQLNARLYKKSLRPMLVLQLSRSEAARMILS